MSFKQIASINYSESKAILELFATLKNETNRYSKLCFSDDGKNVGLETSSSIYRTTLSTVNYVTSIINQTTQSLVSSSILPTGWNREIQTLIPMTQQIAELFTTDSLDQEDAIVSIDLTAEAIEGLKALQVNQYGDSPKADIIKTAISSLDGARNALIKNYSEKKCCTHHIHAISLEKENKLLHEALQQLREENDRLRLQLSKKESEIEPPPSLEEIDPLDEKMLEFGKTLERIQLKLKECFKSQS